HKAIPMGAGLGGGSADGAFALLLLDKKFNLGLSDEQLLQYALQLGSDCPFFIRNTPSFATGRGEKLEDIALDLSAYQFVLVNPGIHIPTGWAFSLLHPADKPSLKSIVTAPVETWKESLTNDFEDPVSQRHPEIATIKTALYQQGALYASMTGSGSTVYGIFPKAAAPQFSFPAHYFVKIV
ncbi:MAG: 4-(cytidine 5'-diphospho)-2-C-methyl-D-erythritol kinase, partial [Bacteroidota bacterium]|nr:4-(cytidine 5'-diphospho)-2-C-methyl-D-erythritol kinase [Bacteroidota bacterium]